MDRVINNSKRKGYTYEIVFFIKKNIECKYLQKIITKIKFLNKMYIDNMNRRVYPLNYVWTYILPAYSDFIPAWN